MSAYNLYKNPLCPCGNSLCPWSDLLSVSQTGSQYVRTDLSPRDRSLCPFRQAKSTTPREFELAVPFAQPQSALPLFSETTRLRALFTVCLLSKEEYLYANADWLNSSVSQMVARGQLAHATLSATV